MFSCAPIHLLIHLLVSSLPLASPSLSAGLLELIALLFLVCFPRFPFQMYRTVKSTDKPAASSGTYLPLLIRIAIHSSIVLLLISDLINNNNPTVPHFLLLLKITNYSANHVMAAPAGIVRSGPDGGGSGDEDFPGAGGQAASGGDNNMMCGARPFGEHHRSTSEGAASSVGGGGGGDMDQSSAGNTSTRWSNSSRYRLLRHSPLY